MLHKRKNVSRKNKINYFTEKSASQKNVSRKKVFQGKKSKIKYFTKKSIINCFMKKKNKNASGKKNNCFMEK